MNNFTYTKLDSNDTRRLYYGKFSYVVNYKDSGGKGHSITISHSSEMTLEEVVQSVFDAISKSEESHYKPKSIDPDSLTVVEAVINDFATDTGGEDLE